MAKILFIHRHGPAQFVHLSTRLARAGHEVTLVCETSDRPMPGVRVLKHRAPEHRLRDGTSTPDYHLRMGMHVAEVLEALKRQEGAPDVIVGHGGWGSLLFTKDVFPSTPVLGYCEFFYQPVGADVGFDPECPTTLDDRRRLKARNFAQTSTLLAIDAGISPTLWQRNLYPDEFKSRIGVVHDGIDMRFCRPDPNARFRLPNGRVLTPGEKIVTYASRDLEPYRGFPQFMRAAAELARRDPDITFVVAGGDGVTYGRHRPDGRPWREVTMQETGLDPARIHFVGTLPHPELIRMFQVSAAHVYLTYPFVLSWSMLEAMATGALVVGSDTPSVVEFIEHGRNGLLAGFFDRDGLVAAVGEALANPARHIALRSAARETVRKRAALETCLQLQSRAIGRLLGRHVSRPRPRAATTGTGASLPGLPADL